MEFFEKAHVVKNKSSSRKNTKSEESVKKELKQMLYGYDHNDNDLIRNVGKAKEYFEDSSSVSGFSDLNLTQSSVEVDLSRDTVNSDSKDFSEADDSELILEKLKENDCDDSVMKTSQSPESESLSDYDEDLKSISEAVSSDQVDGVILSDSSESDLSFIETSTEVDSTSNDESDFDPVGALATQILQKIKKTRNKKEKPKKRKSEMVKDELVKNTNKKFLGPYRPKDSDSNEIEMDDLSADMSNVSLPETRVFTGPYRPRNSSSENNSADDSIHDDASVDSKDSSPFVSVQAVDMTSQSLEEIVGEYRYPTMRNLPCESHVNLSQDLELFETENANVVDIEIEDEVNSLIPEVDDTHIDLEELDQSVELIGKTDLENELDEALYQIDEPLDDDDTLYDNATQSEHTSEREQSTDSIDQFLDSPVKVYYGRGQNCILVLKHPMEIYLHGKVKIKTLGGTIQVLGYTFQDATCNVYAPNYNYAQNIKTLENQNAYYGLFSKLTSAGITVAEAEDIVTSIGEFDGIVLMQLLRSRQMDFVENNFSVTDLFSKSSKSIDNCFKKVSELLGCSLYMSKPWKTFEENSSWEQAIDYGLIPQSRGIVCGGKGVGKSTFLRYYVNKLIANGPVLVIDLDPGQCEFTVAGNMSATIVSEPLLGPNFTHLKTPEIMLNIGMINTMDNPSRYVTAAESLIAYCWNDDKLKQLPWIVNTMGMTNAMGMKFMSLIILHTKPTFLLQIDSNVAKKRYQFHLYPQTVKNLYFEDYQNDRLFSNVKEVNLDYAFLLSQHSENSTKSRFSLAPRDERYLNFLSYFGQLLNMHTEEFLGIVPYEVNLKDLSIGLNVQVKEDDVTKVVNGKVVALCQRLEQDNVFTLADTPLRCFGAGLIRGVDWEKGVLYIITPVAAAQLAEVNCLLYADWVPELRGDSLCQGLPDNSSLPYRTTSHYQQRHFMFSPKRRFNPLQLIKMSRMTN